MSPLAQTIQALLFLSATPISLEDLSAAVDAWPDEVSTALEELGGALDGHGIELAQVAGGWTLRTKAESEAAARRMLARPRSSQLTPAQAEALAIIAYLQPVSRPELARIRGVASDSATSALVERGLVEEAGRSQFGAVLYRTTELFLKSFDLESLDDLPDVGQWDPTPEQEGELRDRLLQAGEARTAGAQAPPAPAEAPSVPTEAPPAEAEAPAAEPAQAPPMPVEAPPADAEAASPPPTRPEPSPAA